jgi:PAS domain S-box-containing protein
VPGSRTQLDPFLDTAPCGFFSFGDDGVVGVVNTTLLEMLGRARDEVVGAHIENLMTVSSRIFYQTHFFPLLRLEGRAEEIFLTLRHQDGSAVPVLANARRAEREGALAIDCVVMQLRQRQKWEEEMMRARRAAEQANSVKAAFISMMSHDLRTPLNAISGYVELITMGIRGPVTEAQLQDLGRIRKASEYLLSMMNDVLSFARLEAGQLDISISAVELEGVLEQAEALVSPQLADAGLIYTRACDTNARVRADADRLQQILLNLLTNAVKFTPPGGSVTLSCESSEEHVILRVRDTGPGIPADQLERIFQPFVQLGQRGPAKAGVGLGLSISRELARAMGGDLTASSVEEEGATFSLTLLRAAESA